MSSKIINVINSIRGNGIQEIIMNEIFLKGNCYQFYLLLKEIFPNSECWYVGNKTIVDHIITKIGEHYYDITGVVDIKQLKGDLYNLDDCTEKNKFLKECGYCNLPIDISKDYIKEFIEQYYNLNECMKKYLIQSKVI